MLKNFIQGFFKPKLTQFLNKISIINNFKKLWKTAPGLSILHYLFFGLNLVFLGTALGHFSLCRCMYFAEICAHLETHSSKRLIPLLVIILAELGNTSKKGCKITILSQVLLVLTFDKAVDELGTTQKVSSTVF